MKKFISKFPFNCFGRIWFYGHDKTVFIFDSYIFCHSILSPSVSIELRTANTKNISGKNVLLNKVLFKFVHRTLNFKNYFQLFSRYLERNNSASKKIKAPINMYFHNPKPVLVSVTIFISSSEF